MSKERNEPGPGLGALVELVSSSSTEREDILRLWIAGVDRNPDITSSNGLTYKQLLDHLPQLCEELAELQRIRRSNECPRRHRMPMVGKRWQQGYLLEEVIREIHLFRRQLFERWLPDFVRQNDSFVGEQNEQPRRSSTAFLKR